jgi:hypothetical protein
VAAPAVQPHPVAPVADPYSAAPVAQPHVAQPQAAQPHVAAPGGRTSLVSPSLAAEVGGYPPNYGTGHDPYAQSVPSTYVQHSNIIAWVSLIAGAVSIVSILLRDSLPSGTFYLPVFGITAILAGIRALVRYRARRVTVRWAPIVGIILGVIAEVLLIATYVAASTALATPTTPVIVGPQGASTNYDMGTGLPQYLPTNNATLSIAAADEAKVVGALQKDYGAGPSAGTGTTATTAWPTQVLHTPSGDVTTSDGRDLGTLIPAGWHLAYTTRSDGSFSLLVSGTDTSEVAFYNSENNEYFAWCAASDTSCTTQSPIPPQQTNGTVPNGPSSST